MLRSASFQERKVRSRDLADVLSEVEELVHEIGGEHIGTAHLETDDANDFFNLEGALIERAHRFVAALLAYKTERQTLTELHEAAAAEAALMQRGELGYGHQQHELI
jgi:hypothetical protein